MLLQSILFLKKPCYDGLMNMDLSAKEILDFYLQAGVDETIGDMPVNWFEQPAVVPASEKETAPSAPRSRAPVSVAPATTTPAPQTSVAIDNARAAATAATDLSSLKEAISNFDGCALKQLATNTVFARGDVAADLMIIDCPPAADEDRNGAPFAGVNGELLTKMLGAIGLDIQKQYLATCLPWRPPGGRAPTAEEIAICRPFLERHIQLKAPRIVLLCGEAAAITLHKKEGINKLRGKWQNLIGDNAAVPTLSIFHPGFLIEHPVAKRHAWADLRKLKAALSDLA